MVLASAASPAAFMLATAAVAPFGVAFARSPFVEHAVFCGIRVVGMTGVGKLFIYFPLRARLCLATGRHCLFFSLSIVPHISYVYGGFPGGMD